MHDNEIDRDLGNRPAPDPKAAQRLTAGLVILTVLAWIVWDAIVYLRIGGVATISTVIGNWQAHSWFLGVPIAVGMGAITAHFLRMTPYPDAGQWLRWALYAVGLGIGILITPRN